MIGSRLGWATYPPGSVPSKSLRATVSRSAVSSIGSPPASTMAKSLPACATTLVFAIVSSP